MSNDYIKRSEATELIANYFRFAASLGEELRTRLAHAANINDWLAEIPAADVRPVVRGEWERKPDPYGFFDDIPVCSACGCTTKMRQEYHYCPNCGADMRPRQVTAKIKRGDNNGL